MALEVTLKKDFLWWCDGIIYQIYTRSFADSNNDGIGDLNGIRQKLDYLANLGISAIWLSPIYPSPDVDFGYDVSDYCSIDPKFGTMDDFDHLVKEAHEKDIRIILDLVMNHSSDQHHWFKEARKSRNNSYHNWYLWHDPSPQGGKPNNWQSMTSGSGWEYVPEIEQYYFHMFYREQPDLNWHNPSVHQAMLDVFRFWLGKGVDGYRLDSVNVYFKDQTFINNPPKFGLRPFDMQDHIHDTDQTEMLPLLRELRSVLDEKPELYLIGEPFIPVSPLDFLFHGTTQISARYCGNDLLNQLFCFDFLHCPWNPKKYKEAIQNWDNSLMGKAIPTYVLGNHDNPRPATRLAKGEDDRRLKVAAVMLLTLRGTPYLYNGDEIGQRDIQLKRSEIKDPVGKVYWPLYQGRDGCRAPMQWDGTENSGFSLAQPWLPVHPDYPHRNIAAQIIDPDSLLNVYRQLILLRQQKSALTLGDFRFIEPSPKDTLIYVRSTSDLTIMVVLNFSSSKREVKIDQFGKRKWSKLFSSLAGVPNPINDRSLTLQGDEALILQLEG